MASSQKDSSPNMGGKAAKGMKNVDGRLGPQAGPKPSMNDKAVNDMPNEGAPVLKQNPGHID